MGPACPNCRSPLTWYGQSWGCDRCRVAFTQQQLQQQPQIPAAPLAQMPGMPQTQMPVAPSMPSSVQAFGQPQLPVIPKTIPIDTFQQQQYPSASQYPQAAQPYLQSQQSSHLVPTQRAATTVPGSRKKLLIVAGAATVILAGVGVAIVTTRGGGGSSKLGLDTRDALVKATFKSYGAGDVDGLMKRSGMPGLKRYVTCDKDHTDSAEKQKDDLTQMRNEIARAAARLKGAEIKVGKIKEAGEPELMAKGAELGPGCTLKAPLEMHALTVELDIIHAEGSSEPAQVEMSVGKLDGMWFYSGAPSFEGCLGAVAKIASISAEEIREQDLVNEMQPMLMRHCLGDKWGTTIEKCLIGASSLGDIRTCLGTLPTAALTAYAKDVRTALVNRTDVQKRLVVLVPDPTPVAEPPKPTETPGAGAGSQAVATTKPGADGATDDLVPEVAPVDPNGDDRGRPEQGEYGDFWLWERSDAKYRVTSPLVSVVFPGKPEQKFVRGAAKTADGKDFYLYQFVHDLGEDGMLRLEVSALGRNATESGDDPVVKMMSQIGAVHRKKQVVNGVSIVDLEAKEASGGTLRTHSIRDMKRGIIIVAVVATSPKTRAVGTAFLGSVKALDPKDPTEDPELLAGVSSRKAGKKFLAYTASEDFTMELPAKPTISRAGPEEGKHQVTISGASEKKGMEITFELKEFASWDGLTYTPDKQQALADSAAQMLEQQTGKHFKVTPGDVGGQPGFKIDQTDKGKPKVQMRMTWNRFQHRTLLVICTDAKCDEVADSVKWAEPAAE